MHYRHTGPIIDPGGTLHLNHTVVLPCRHSCATCHRHFLYPLQLHPTVKGWKKNPNSHWDLNTFQGKYFVFKYGTYLDYATKIWFTASWSWSKFDIIQLHLVQKVPWQIFKTSCVQISKTANNYEIYMLLPKPCPWMWHLMCQSCVRNDSDRKPETGETCSPKLALLKIPIGAALSTRTCVYSLNQHKGLRLDRQFLLHLNAVLIIHVIIDSTVLCIVLHTVHRNFQKCNFWWMHSACFGPPFLKRFSPTRYHIKE